MELDLLIRDGLVCGENTEPFLGCVGVKDGKIAIVSTADVQTPARVSIDARGQLIMPGMIDAHVHIGHGSAHAEEFWTEGRSAIIGGVTTLLTFYRRHPFDYLRLVPRLIADGEANSPIDFGIHLPLFTRANIDELRSYYDNWGIGGFKFFPGINSEDAAKMTDLPHTGPMLPIDDAFVLDGMRRVATLPGAVALYHAENPDVNAAAAEAVKASGRSDLRAWCDSRPDYGEAHSVRDALWWQRLTSCPLYVVHLSSAIAFNEIQDARARGTAAPVYVETCPQFLTMTRDAPIGTIGKMSPPFRTEEDCERLWQGIAEGEVDTIGSDHGAFRREEKADAWTGRSGFPGMATILPVLVTQGLHKGRISISDIVRIFSANPARIFGLFPQKGSLAPGTDADLIVVDTENPDVVEPTRLESRSDFSIYEGQSLAGWPSTVVAGGDVIFTKDEGIVADRGRGRFLTTSTT